MAAASNGTGKGADMATIELAGERYVVTNTFWVRHASARAAPTYEELALRLKALDVKDVAADVRALVTTGNCKASGKDKILVSELTLAIAGAEYARNRRSFAMAMMMLDLIEGDFRYGYEQNKGYSWDKILTAANVSLKKALRLQGDTLVCAALEARHKASASQSARPLEAAIFALWGGKLPMCHAGSEAEGSHELVNHNVLTIKEINLFSHWARAMAIPMRFRNLEVGQRMLTDVFKVRARSGEGWVLCGKLVEPSAVGGSTTVGPVLKLESKAESKSQ